MTVIRFHFADRRVTLLQRGKLKGFLTALFEAEKVSVRELHYVFCSDGYLLPLNEQFLGHDTFTDIITFVLSEPKQPVVSDVYVSVDRVKENSAALGVTFTRELHRVIFHGALHLCGYGDKTEVEKKRMRKREDYLLSKYFVPRETN